MIKLKCGCTALENDEGAEIRYRFDGVCKVHRANPSEVMLSEIICQQALIAALEKANGRLTDRARMLDEKNMDFKAGENGRAAGIDWAINKMCTYCAAGNKAKFEVEDHLGVKFDSYFHAFEDGGQDCCHAQNIHLGLMEAGS